MDGLHRGIYRDSWLDQEKEDRGVWDDEELPDVTVDGAAFADAPGDWAPFKSREVSLGPNVWRRRRELTLVLTD